MMVRKSRLAATGLALLALAGCAADKPNLLAPAASSSATVAVRKQPNIIVIMADDLGYADVSIYPGGRIPTPNIDRLGKTGVVFTEGYVTAPICSPSRAGLMTGRYQQRFGFEYNNGPDTRDFNEKLGLDTTEVTLAQALKAAGYRTAGIGKWHLGASEEHYPTRRGFDEWWGFLSGQSNYIEPDAPDAINGVAPPKAGEGMSSIGQPYAQVDILNAVVTGPSRTRVDLGKGYLTEQITDQALAFIDRNQDQPFFLHLAYNAPHSPFQVTRKYYDRFPGIENRRDRIYAGMVSALDDGVGAVLDRLDRLGLSDNTIVIFLSDNGCAAYVPGLCDSKVLSGGKITQMEGGIRVPFLMRWPGRIKPNTVYRAPVSSMDVFPTVVAAAGARLPDRRYDGFDLMPQLTASKATWSRPPLFWRSLPVRSVREGDWKFHQDFDGVAHLYNLRADPREQTNLAAAEPARVAAMRALLADWERDKVAPAWEGRFAEFDFAGRHYKFRP